MNTENSISQDDDGSSYTPDFFVKSPFGECYIECHRIKSIKPGDEEKVDRLLRIVDEDLIDAPLILFDKEDMIRIFKLVNMSY